MIFLVFIPSKIHASPSWTAHYASCHRYWWPSTLNFYWRLHTDSGTHYINCHRCGDSITLTITGHPRNFYNHINGNVCKRNSNLLRGNNPSQSSESIFHIQTSSHSESGYNNASPISNISGIISSFSNLHASSPNPTPAPEMLDSRVLRPQSHAARTRSDRKETSQIL